MTEHPLELIRSGGRTPDVKPRHPLENLDSTVFSKHLVLFRPNEEVLRSVMDKARQSIPGLTDVEAVQRVIDYNPDCMWAISRKRKFNPDVSTGDGFIAMLPLNNKGLVQVA